MLFRNSLVLPGFHKSTPIKLKAVGGTNFRAVPRHSTVARHSLNSSSAAMTEPWLLFYWPGIKGRGEYVRLVFEEAGVPYVDVGLKEGFQSIVDHVFEKGTAEGSFPIRAPPAIQKGDFKMCNTPAIMLYLGKVFGLCPSKLEDEAHVNQVLNVVVSDAVSEGRLAFHPVDFYATHKVGSFIEAVLKSNKCGPNFLVGSELSVADLATYHFLCAAERHYKPYYDAQEAPLAKALQSRVAQRPRIAAYLASDRCQPWDADSMM
ncbi:hypothetical protein DUNSADRAFT_16621 [Dunaliella salina]|uniref:Glutathione transferase n=1 Tax=Dunaliella salina TaxID=3046 RepID=A0ABQ7G382_DUNSA|nr:hypothetical protein DUNSADRAFT_16621 [Dunaliella salina]|eukprot:KAF5829064.1 hypothetical protein DUNSADRAFT_16621 [Dunaliella salina]